MIWDTFKFNNCTAHYVLHFERNSLILASSVERFEQSHQVWILLYAVVILLFAACVVE